MTNLMDELKAAQPAEMKIPQYRSILEVQSYLN